MRIPIANLDGIETFTPRLTAQEQAKEATIEFLTARVRRLESALVAVQLYARMGDSRAIAAVVSQVLTGL